MSDMESLILCSSGSPNMLHRWDLTTESIKCSYNLAQEDDIIFMQSIDNELYLGGSHQGKGIATIVRVKEDDLEIVWRGLFPDTVYSITKINQTLIVASYSTVINI